MEGLSKKRKRRDATKAKDTLDEFRILSGFTWMNGPVVRVVSFYADFGFISPFRTDLWDSQRSIQLPMPACRRYLIGVEMVCVARGKGGPPPLK
jgi:hypothetical protein